MRDSCYSAILDSTSQASYNQVMVALRDTGDDSLAEELCETAASQPY